MSADRFVEKLLDGADVDWLPLGELGELVRGSGLPKSDFTESGVPAIHYGQIYTHYGLSTSSTISFVSTETAAKLKKVNTGDVVITNTSENYEDVGTPLVYFGKKQAVTGGHATIFKPSSKILGMYLAYFTQTYTFQKLKRPYSKGAKVIDVSAKDLSKILIPIPCPGSPKKSLRIQREIVRILDSFTSLTAELTAELTSVLIAAQKQRSHYREQLLKFDKGEVDLKPLGEVANYRRGSFPQPYGDQKWYDGEGAMPFVQVAQVDKNMRLVENTKRKISKIAQPKSVFVPKGTVVVTLQGSIGRVAITQYDSYVDRTLGIFQSYKIEIDKKYFAYQLEAKFDHERKKARGDIIKTITKEEFTQFKIPIPPLPQQRHIAKTLDNFDKIMNTLAEELSNEISLREKQYAYYRDQLLNFPKPVEAAA